MTAVLLKSYVDDERAKDALNKGLECFENHAVCISRREKISYG